MTVLRVLRRRLALRLRVRTDEGFAMVSVIGTMLVLSLLVVLATTAALGSVSSARADQDHQSALGAAEAGIDDYLSHLTLDATYFTKGNTDAGNPALGSSGFTPLSGSTTGAGFRYRLLSDPAGVNATGQLVLEATGRSGEVTRTVRVTLARKSFLDYLWFSTYETLDPLNTSDPTLKAACAQFAWAGRPSHCEQIAFGGNDLLRGPVYSQDTLVMTGAPTFQSTVETGWDDPNKNYWAVRTSSTASPVFSGGPPRYSSQLMPSTNAALRNQALLGNGCLYTGPTRVVFKSDGSMDVTSPFTTNSTYDCGSFTAPSYKANVRVPDNGVVYVDQGTSDCTTSANITRWGAVGFPISNDTSQTGVDPKLGYSCNNGDAFVEGVVKGRVTVGTVNNVVITHHLTYSGGSTGADVVGLAAGNFVQLYRPITCSTGYRESGTNRCLAGTDVSVAGRYPWLNPDVQAAVVATSRAFFLQNWGLSGTGPTGSARALGTLKLTGAIAQRFRGPMGVANSGGYCNGICGYTKDYYYDSRLRYAPPPYLADLTQSAWGLVSFAEGPS